MEDGTLVDVLDADIVEDHILDHIVVATVDGEASLIVNLRLTLAEDVDVLVAQAADGVALL